MRKLYHLTLRRLRGYKRSEDGATAIEFAMLAIPFFSLIFAILELAIVFFISSSLNHAVSEAGRQIRIGNFQNCGKAAFKTQVCDTMISIGSCENNLRLDVIKNTTFGEITLPAIPQPTIVPPGSAPPPVANGDYDESDAGEPVVVRALFYHKLILPAQLTRLGSSPGSNTRIIRSTTAFRNEPFPTGSCSPTPPGS